MQFFSCNENDEDKKIPEIRRILNESLGCEVLGWFVNHIATLRNAPSYFGGLQCHERSQIVFTSLYQSIYLIAMHGRSSTTTQESFTSASKGKTFSILGMERTRKEKMNGVQKYRFHIQRWKSMSILINSAEQSKALLHSDSLSKSKRADYTERGTGICYPQSGRDNRDGILYKGCNIDSVGKNEKAAGLCEINSVKLKHKIDTVKSTVWTLSNLQLMFHRKQSVMNFAPAEQRREGEVG